MFNKLVKGFVVGVALIGSLTMVGCESTMDEENYTVETHVSGQGYDPQSKAWAEAIINEVYLDCTECGGQQSICERSDGLLLYDACGYCFAVYEDDKFTGKYACNGCDEIVDHKTKPINGEGTVLVCNDCYNEYHKPKKVNENLVDENGRIKNTIPEIEEVEEITEEQAYEIILSEATRLYGNVEVNASDIGYNGIVYYANVINPEDREILASIKVDCITGEVVEVVE